MLDDWLCYLIGRYLYIYCVILMCFYDYLSNFGCGVGVFVVVFLVWLRGYFNIFVVVFLRYFFCDLNSFFGNCNIKYLKF